MALQDLTPQLRTRLSRMERLVGLFVTAATLLLVFGLAYYVYELAKRKGWFDVKVGYSTSVNSAAGLKVGDDVRLMGFNVGRITRVEANDPYDAYNVTIFFDIKAPYYGYLWSDSIVKVASADLLGNRNLEVIKGQEGLPTVFERNSTVEGLLDQAHLTNLKEELRARFESTGVGSEEVDKLMWQEIWRLYSEDAAAFYDPGVETNFYWLTPRESPALADRMEQLVKQVETALPGVMDLTNRISSVLANLNVAISNLDTVAVGARPVVDNLARISENVQDPDGSLGEWLVPNDLQAQLLETLAAANGLFTNSDARLTSVATNLDESLIHLANLTSNLNAQVQANSNILGGISEAVTHADELVQGLKRHWLLRSAFKDEERDEARERREPRPDGPIPTRGARIYR